ncbi:MAG TPA: membrane protein insertase YidC [Armatimonadetes bacterium]|nr:membrane protein insertase YidC [Armatimonadota bacterium]
MAFGGVDFMAYDGCCAVTLSTREVKTQYRRLGNSERGATVNGKRWLCWFLVGMGVANQAWTQESWVPERPAAKVKEVEAKGHSLSPGETQKGPPLAEQTVEEEAGEERSAPPFKEVLLLRAETDPIEQVRALEAQVRESPKDPLTPQRWFTIGYLYDFEIPKSKEQALAAYRQAARFPRFPYAAQAQLRCAEIYEELGEGKRALGTYQRLVYTLQRAREEVPLWSQRGKEYVPVTYEEVLRRVDEKARRGFFYQVLDHLVHLTGNVPGFSHILALILLAVLLKLLTHPFTRKQYESMAKMQEIQPLMKKIQDKYKGNPERMQRELLALYRKHKANPLGGCWPMLIQLPLFILVYQGIRAYQYHFSNVQFLWIKNLAGPDTPLLLIYAVSMFLQQRLMTMRTVPADPAQQQQQQMMSIMMPLLFTYMMWIWQLPSAFYLYWLAFNVVSTIEQWVVLKRFSPTGGATAQAVNPNQSEPSNRPLAGEKRGKGTRQRPPLSVVPPEGKGKKKKRVARRH